MHSFVIQCLALVAYVGLYVTHIIQITFKADLIQAIGVLIQTDPYIGQP